MKRITRSIAIMTCLILGMSIYYAPVFAAEAIGTGGSAPVEMITADGVQLTEVFEPEEVCSAAPAAENEENDGADPEAAGETLFSSCRLLVGGIETIPSEEENISDSEPGITDGEVADIGNPAEEPTTDPATGDTPADPQTDSVTDPTDPQTDPVTDPADPQTDPVTDPTDPQTDSVTAPADPQTDPVTDPAVNLDTFGATGGAVYDGDAVLTYEDEEATEEAYASLCEKYGSDRILIDVPVYLESSNWADDLMHYSAVKGEIQNTGMDATVAVLDSGIYSSHNLFRGRAVGGGYDFVNKDSKPSDDNGHGTFVSGIIAQNTGSNIGIMPIKVLDSKGQGSALDVIYGVEYAKKHGADVVNISAGFNLTSKFSKSEAYNWVRAADTYLRDFPGPIVTAAGNGVNEKGISLNSNYVWPAVSGLTIAVSALKKSGSSAVRATYSNYGDIDFSAPGSNIYSAGRSSTSSYSVGSGTSFAAPHISAAAALVIANEPSLTTSGQVKSVLRSIAVDLSGSGWDKYYGYGYPDMKFLPAGSGVSRPISRATISIASQVYTGGAITPVPTVRRGAFALRRGTQYQIVGYRNNRNVGTASVVINGMGRYTGTVTKTFRIIPRGTSIKKLKKKKKAITVKWKKQATLMPVSPVTGYQVQVARNSSFSKGKKTLTVRNYNKTSLKVTKLKAKKKYYVRVRTYMVVGGAKYYSNWSRTKTMRTK